MCMLVKCEKVCENLCRMPEGRQCIEDWYGRVLCKVPEYGMTGVRLYKGKLRILDI